MPSLQVAALLACQTVCFTCLVCLYVLLSYVLLELSCLAGGLGAPCIHPNTLAVLLVPAERVEHQQLELFAEVQLDLLLQPLGALQGCCGMSALSVSQGWEGWLQCDADITVA